LNIEHLGPAVELGHARLAPEITQQHPRAPIGGCARADGAAASAMQSTMAAEAALIAFAITQPSFALGRRATPTTHGLGSWTGLGSTFKTLVLSSGLPLDAKMTLPMISGEVVE
jgi:hypothetical protein